MSPARREEFFRALAAAIPDARVRIVERAGHNAHAERPDIVVPSIAEFLDAAQGGSPRVLS